MLHRTSVGAERVLITGASGGVGLAAVQLGQTSVGVVLDLVGGEKWPQLLAVLRIGGRYCTAGAIAGALTELDLRALYPLSQLVTAQQEFLSKGHVGKIVVVPPQVGTQEDRV